MSVYHCVDKDGRLILGRFYKYGEKIEIDDEHSALAFSMMQKKILERGEFSGKVDALETREMEDSTQEMEEDTPKKAIRKKV